MHRSHFTRLFAVAAVGAILTAGCGGEDPAPTATVTATSSASTPATPTPTTPTPTTESATPSTPAPTPDVPDDTPAPVPFPANTAPDTSTASASASLSPVTIRVAAHDGYDRLVLDLTGTGQPGWNSRYVDDPRADGSGEPIDLDGVAYLQTTVKGVIYPTETGAQEYVGARRFHPASADVIAEVVYGDVFEGQAEVYIGLRSKQPFRVFLLEDPTRIVVDIYQP